MTETTARRIPDLADLDEAGRPKAPPVPGATDHDRRRGLHLAAIHRGHLMEMHRLAQILDQVAAGVPGAADQLADAVPAMEMVRNMQAVGTLCGRECQMLTFHHDIEEAQMFPGLDSVGNAGLSAVVAKLKAEHLVVHELIDLLAADAETLRRDPSAEALKRARESFEALGRVVRSHFGYEETELQEALGHYFGDAI
ncbi:hemerythrin domain-containing protein [Pelagovum pacificum]|uniref:Hemerythrin-like domain-containing protein n=1 Tax=Pelagovum pacificum TaxID=2588711 RepID=A0A5C5G7K5_9RHOB|nr:hemerythrin domain-containing protein [Pelagovum pacificum]QQA41813.1 hemerythrin domain-containing protein [Pelagovum pacificum]TNY30743.1 hypothetical protein FHY64_19405 [Pelagovum pacificum]